MLIEGPADKFWKAIDVPGSGASRLLVLRGCFSDSSQLKIRERATAVCRFTLSWTVQAHIPESTVNI